MTRDRWRWVLTWPCRMISLIFFSFLASTASVLPSNSDGQINYDVSHWNSPTCHSESCLSFVLLLTAPSIFFNTIGIRPYDDEQVNASSEDLHNHTHPRARTHNLPDFLLIYFPKHPLVLLRQRPKKKLLPPKGIWPPLGVAFMVLGHMAVVTRRDKLHGVNLFFVQQA